MPGRVLDRLERRVTFVVGKGGVGKSTTAAALALALADGGTPTHLLSTDPAHSLGDVLGDDPAPDPRPSRCSADLTIEELDAERVVSARLGSLAPGLRELIDRGTYLDQDDAASLLDAALPGLDEIGALLRIRELAEAGGRLVVDTAPTGHTLRLLDVPAALTAWVRVFEAMAAKADAVRSALVGRHVPMEAEALLEALLDDAEQFAAAARGADFLVVSAAGDVVAAETRRLIDALGARGLHVAVTVAIDRHGAEADVLLPARPGLAGCDALRDWWAGGGGERPAAEGPGGPAAGPGARTASPRGGSHRTRLPLLPPELERGLVVFAGKGGVGKSTCAAATAVVKASRGPVMLVGVDPAGSLGDVLPDPPSGLEVTELRADRELEQLKELYRAEVEEVFAAVGLDRAARLDREVVESLWDLAPPGIDELMAVSRLAAEPDLRTRLVLDTAPTGHFLRLVAMPGMALDWTHRIMRILLKYRALGSLDGPGEHLLRFAKRFRGLRERLADGSRTAIVLVTLDEPLARTETRRLVERLDALGLVPAAVLVNRATAPVSRDLPFPTFAAPVVAEPVGPRALSDFVARWQRVP